MESGDWRALLQADSRERIVNKIMETLKWHSPFSDLALQDLKGIAMRFEEKIYTIATSQSDYLRKISLEMLSVDTRSQNPMPDATQANNGFNPLDPENLNWEFTRSMAIGHQAPSVSDMAIDNVSSGSPEGDPSMESGDWRVQLQADSRKRIVNKIMEILKRHSPFFDLALQDLKGIAMRFEEKIYTAATSQSDYLRKISLEMLSVETRSQNPMPDAMQANNGLNPLDPGSLASGHQAVSISDMAIDNVSSGAESDDWRAQLQTDSRKRIVNKMMEILKRHLPFSDQDAAALHEVKKIAVRFEEKAYNNATSQSDYLRTISLKMLTMETRSQNPMPDATQANNGFNPLDPGNVARGHQASSISDMARDNVSCPSGGTHSYSHDESAPSWNALNKQDSSLMLIESVQQFARMSLAGNDLSDKVSAKSIVQGKGRYTFL